MEAKRPNVSKIPVALKERNQWVTWKAKELVKGRKPTKVDMNPNTTGYAKTDDAKTWASFETAINCFNSNGRNLTGIGYVVNYNDPYTLFDLDNCRNPETSIIEPWATEIIESINSYSEESYSGTGVTIVAEGRLKERGRKKGDIEAYSSHHFKAMTGKHLEGTPTTIEPRQTEIDSFYQKYFAKDEPEKKGIPKPNQTSSLDDQELIEKIKQSKGGNKFQKLFTGDFSDYPSWSEADLALCSILAFWTENNPSQIDALFRQSGLMRDKWDEKHGSMTYGQMTINKAIQGTPEVYKPSQNTELTKGVIDQKRNLTEDIRSWVVNAFSKFSTDQIYRDLSITTANEKAHVRVELGRMVEKKILERGPVNGTFIKIESQTRVLEIKAEKPTPLTVSLPGDLQKRVSIYKHNLLVVAGSSNGGKTAYALNAAYDNRDKFDVHYLTTEMDSDELTLRVHNFGYPLKEWNKVTFKPWESIHSIKPDAFNVVDYLEVREGEFWRVGDDLRKIFEKLNTGIALVCLQMDKGSKFGWGGQKTVDKARLYFTLDDNKLTIVKGKNWAGLTNPNGEVIPFKIIGGARFEWGTQV